LEAVDGVLILTAIILFAGAFLEAKSWAKSRSADDADLKHVAESQAAADRIAASADMDASDGSPFTAQSSPQPAHAATSAADLVGPLSVILSRLMKFPTTGNPVLDELLFAVRGSVKDAADEAVDGVVHTVRHGDRAKLVAVLGTAVLVGWLLARHRADDIRSD
jgi:hypothetical protein